MLSRVAESLYWVGRYIERAENTARIVNVNGHLLLDLPPGVPRDWSPLIAITGSADTFLAHYQEYDERSVVRFLVADDTNPGSILTSLSSAREGTRTIRDIVPREVWELINELYLYAKENQSSGLSKRGRFTYLARIIRGAQTLLGMVQGTMNHDAGFEFLRLGRVLERADMTTRIIDVRSSSLLLQETSGLRPFENIQWMSVLKSLTGYQMYRQKMQARVQRDSVLRFLLLDPDFPRSFLRCVNVVNESVSNLPGGESVERALARLRRMVLGADIGKLGGSERPLQSFVDQLQIGLGQVHDEIANTWFLPEAAAVDTA